MANAEDTVQQPFAIVIHGGAGTILRKNLTPEIESAYREKLTEAVNAGYQLLKSGGNSRAAVVAAITVMEDSPLFNAGKGAVFNHEGNIELDASIMEGARLNAGAVASVTTVKSPIALANTILERSPHVMLIGRGAEIFAEREGLELVDNNYFKTERRRRALERAIAKEKNPNCLKMVIRWKSSKIKRHSGSSGVG